MPIVVTNIIESTVKSGGEETVFNRNDGSNTIDYFEIDLKVVKEEEKVKLIGCRTIVVFAKK